MTTTAFVITPISTPPEKDGPYQLCYFAGEVSDFKGMFKEGKWQKIPDKFFSYLRPIDLSTLLAEAFNKGVESAKENSSLYPNKFDGRDIEYSEHDITKDRIIFINKTLNGTK